MADAISLNARPFSAQLTVLVGARHAAEPVALDMARAFELFSGQALDELMQAAGRIAAMPAAERARAMPALRRIQREMIQRQSEAHDLGAGAAPGWLDLLPPSCRDELRAVTGAAPHPSRSGDPDRSNPEPDPCAAGSGSKPGSPEPASKRPGNDPGDQNQSSPEPDPCAGGAGSNKEGPTQ